MCLVRLPDVVAVCLLDQIEEVPHSSLEISIKWLLQYYCINTFGSYYVELHSRLNGHIFTKQIMFREQRAEDGLGARSKASSNYDIVILFTSGSIVSISTCHAIPSFMTDDNGEATDSVHEWSWFLTQEHCRWTNSKADYRYQVTRENPFLVFLFSAGVVECHCGVE